MISSVRVMRVNRSAGGSGPVPAGSVASPGSAQPPARAGPLPLPSPSVVGWVGIGGVADGREGVISFITRDDISTPGPWPGSTALIGSTQGRSVWLPHPSECPRARLPRRMSAWRQAGG